MNIRSVSQYSPSRSTLRPQVATDESFMSMLREATRSVTPNTSDQRIAAHAQQLFTDSIENLKKKKINADTIHSSETDTDEESAASKTISPKNILKGIFEETGGPSLQQVDTVPKIYMGHIPTKKNVLLAQAQNSNVQQRTAGPFNRRTPGAVTPPNRSLTTTPFQIFLDKAVDFFEMVSQTEQKSDLLVKEYIEGKATLEEVSVSRAKMSIAVTFAMTLVNQVVQSFKEIQNMQV